MTEHPLTEPEITEHPLFALATESYVLLSTFRTTGVGVGTPEIGRASCRERVF